MFIWKSESQGEEWEPRRREILQPLGHSPNPCHSTDFFPGAPYGWQEPKDITCYYPESCTKARETSLHRTAAYLFSVFTVLLCWIFYTNGIIYYWSFVTRLFLLSTIFFQRPFMLQHLSGREERARKGNQGGALQMKNCYQNTTLNLSCLYEYHWNMSIDKDFVVVIVMHCKRHWHSTVKHMRFILNLLLEPYSTALCMQPHRSILVT